MGTVAQIVDDAAELLGRKRAGQSIEATMSSRLKRAYTAYHAELKNDRLVTWPSGTGTTVTVPDEMVPHIAAVVAHRAARSYRPSEEIMNRIREARSEANERIPQLLKPKYESTTLVEDF